MKPKIIIDTDCGMDDIIAILMLIQSNKFDIIGISTVFGLVSPKVGKNNLLRILTAINRSIPVISGKTKPIYPSYLNFPPFDIVRSSKLCFLKKFLPIKPPTKNSVIAIRKLLSQKVTIVCLGPLTNISSMLIKYPNLFVKNVTNLTIMGGAVYVPGNTPKKIAEYNIGLDPQAAINIFKSAIPVTLIPLDACYQVPVTKQFLTIIKALKPKTKIGQIIKTTIISNQKDFRYFYDPLTTSILIDPFVIKKYTSLQIKVSKSGKLIPINNKPSLTKVVTKIDLSLFKKLLLKLIK